MLKTGLPAEVVSKWLGHANINTMAGIYGHVLPDIQEETVVRFSQLMVADDQQ